jgi:hypothetical protein
VSEPRCLSRYSDGLRAGRPEFSTAGSEDFSLLRIAQTGYVAHAASYSMGTLGFLAEIKWPGRESYPPPPNAEAKNDGAVPPLSDKSSCLST